ncbi:MMPL family transporter [Streptomyces sp. NRRL S-340]|uniref:MMPL family transporter n=1 Tax=Streptomyces sp. NRRL S-340 TaxID=1463901 RepID=UPI000D19B3BF
MNTPTGQTTGVGQTAAVGPAPAVAFDAFLVRTALAPAVLALLGHRPRWPPRFLNRVPPDRDIGVRRWAGTSRPSRPRPTPPGATRLPVGQDRPGHDEHGCRRPRGAWWREAAATATVGVLSRARPQARCPRQRSSPQRRGRGRPCRCGDGREITRWCAACGAG